MSAHHEQQYSYEKFVLKSFLALQPIVKWEDLLIEQTRIIDFRFHAEKGIVGIELTRFSRDNGASAKRQHFYDSIVKNAYKLFYSKYSIHLHVNVHFWHKDKISPKKAPLFSGAIVDTISENLDLIKATTISKSVTLPFYIDDNIEGKLYIYNVGDDIDSFWTRSDPCWVRQSPYVEMQAIINKKNEKIDRYRSCSDKIYLLISANRSQQAESVAFTDKLLKQRFYTQFDKVFFFDICTHDLYQLKTTKLKCLSGPYIRLKRTTKPNI